MQRSQLHTDIVKNIYVSWDIYAAWTGKQLLIFRRSSVPSSSASNSLTSREVWPWIRHAFSIRRLTSNWHCVTSQKTPIFNILSHRLVRRYQTKFHHCIVGKLEYQQSDQAGTALKHRSCRRTHVVQVPNMVAAVVRFCSEFWASTLTRATTVMQQIISNSLWAYRTISYSLYTITFSVHLTTNNLSLWHTMQALTEFSLRIWQSFTWLRNYTTFPQKQGALLCSQEPDTYPPRPTYVQILTKRKMI